MIQLVPLLWKGWALFVKAAAALWAFVLKYPVPVAFVVLAAVVVWQWAGHREAKAEWDAERAVLVDERDDARSRAKALAEQRNDAVNAIAAARQTVRLQADELARRDREDAQRRKNQSDQVARAEAARKDAEAVAKGAIAQLEQAARRRPSCAALLDADLQKECGL